MYLLCKEKKTKDAARRSTNCLDNAKKPAPASADTCSTQTSFRGIRKLYDKMEQRPDAAAEKNPDGTDGLPESLKQGIESLSGISMDDVKVHYNSPMPEQIGALAYTMGTDIHIAPGQQKHLSHEAWHVVQQKRGCVKPETLIDGMPANFSEALENESDIMGKRAEMAPALNSGLAKAVSGAGCIQCCFSPDGAPGSDKVFPDEASKKKIHSFFTNAYKTKTFRRRSFTKEKRKEVLGLQMQAEINALNWGSADNLTTPDEFPDITPDDLLIESLVDLLSESYTSLNITDITKHIAAMLTDFIKNNPGCLSGDSLESVQKFILYALLKELSNILQEYSLEEVWDAFSQYSGEAALDILLNAFPDCFKDTIWNALQCAFCNAIKATPQNPYTNQIPDVISKDCLNIFPDSSSSDPSSCYSNCYSSSYPGISSSAYCSVPSSSSSSSPSSSPSSSSSSISSSGPSSSSSSGYSSISSSAPSSSSSSGYSPSNSITYPSEPPEDFPLTAKGMQLRHIIPNSDIAGLMHIATSKSSGKYMNQNYLTVLRKQMQKLAGLLDLPPIKNMPADTNQWGNLLKTKDGRNAAAGFYNSLSQSKYNLFLGDGNANMNLGNRFDHPEYERQQLISLGKPALAQDLKNWWFETLNLIELEPKMEEKIIKDKETHNQATVKILSHLYSRPFAYRPMEACEVSISPDIM